MAWETPFVIYRILADGKLDEVYRARDIKDAKYWLQYIAKPGDVLCKTPSHPKHSKKGEAPEYHSHKQTSGSPTAAEGEWKTYAQGLKFDGVFPTDHKPIA